MGIQHAKKTPDFSSKPWRIDHDLSVKPMQDGFGVP